MPRIDPMKLLVCLSVLLAPNGGIRNAGEVRRLANLMAKFSKKLVSKAIYIQILKCTETELLGQFMQTGGWTLVHTWLVDGIASKNWPLIQELMELLLCCPVDVERLKINSTPRLVKSLSTDSAHESVKVLATKLVEQWLYIVKAPKQLSPMVPINQSELLAVAGGQAGTTEGKHQHTADGTNSVLPIGVAAKQGGDSGNGTGNHYHQNGYALHTTGKGGVDNKQQSEIGRDDVDGGKTTFQTVGGELQQGLPIVAPKKTSLVLKITTKNGKQVVAKVIKPNKKQQRGPHGTGDEDDDQDDDDADDDDEEEDQEEVVVNIESGKSTDETVATNQNDEKDVSGTKKIDVQNGIESSSKERNTSSSKEKDRHHHSHREKEKDRKGSSSSGSRSSSSKSSGSSSNSSSKHKSSSSSSSKSSSSSSSRSKDKDRHSSSSSSSSKHKTSSSSSSSKSSSSSGSKSNSSSSDKHRDHKDKSSHSTGGSSSSSSSSNARDSKNQSQSFSSPKLSRKNSRDDGAGGSNDSGSESSSTTNTSANGAKTTKSASATTIPNKKASISIEVRNPENRPKTVKTYNSQFRSHGLIEEAPPPPSRKGLKKPTSTSPSTASTNSTSTTIGSTAIGTVKRSSPIPTGRDAILAGSPVEKKPREDPIERPGSIKLIPPKRQHALVESDMFMDALSATLRKDVKKRKRRTSGSEGATTTVASSSTKPGESTAVNKPAGADASTTKVPAPGSPTSTADDSASEATTPTTPTSPKVPTIAPMSFYRDTLAEQEEENGSGSTATEDGTKKEEADTEHNDADGKKITADETEVDDDGPILKKPKRVKCELNEEDDEEEKDGETVEKTSKKQPAEGDGNDDEKTELMAVVMSDVEKKIAEEAEGEKKEDSEKEDESPTDGRKPPGPGCGPDGPPGVLVIHRRKGPKKQLRWKTAEELEEVRYFELDVTERCNVTKSFTDMKQMERVDERQKFMLSRKVGSEDIMVERTTWRALVQVDNVPASPDGNQSLERNVQRQRERGCLQALYFNKHMIPDSPIEPDPADIYQTADPVHIPLEDVTGNPDSVNDFTSVPWPDPKSTPPHESGAFNSPFFPSDLPPAAGFGPGGFPPPFAPGAAATIGPGPWNMGPPGGAGPRPGVLPPGMFPLNQPPPGMGPGSGGGGGGSPNMLNMPLNMSPNVPPPGMFPGATNFNAPPPELGLMAGGPDMGGRRGPPGPGGVDFRNGPPPPQQWVTGNRPFVGGNNPSRGGAGAGGFGNRGGGGGGGNWNNRNNGNNGNRNGGGDRGRMGDDGRGNYRGHWLQNNRGHNRGGGGRKW